MSPSFEVVAKKLKMQASKWALCTGWEAAFQTSSSGAAAFLSPSFVVKAAEDVGLTEEMGKVLAEFAVRVAKDPEAVDFFWYCRHRVLHDKTLVESWEEQWPPLDEYYGQEAGLLNVLVMLSCVPEMLATYAKIGLPKEIMLDTVGDLKRWMETDYYYLHFKKWGITPWIARWLCKHWQARILHLKRLQFGPDKLALPLRVYRRRGLRNLICLAEPGLRFGSTGDAWSECCGPDPGAWTSIFKEEGDAVVGNPITGDGKAHRETVRLKLKDWRLVLKQGDDMLSINIPTGGPLSFEACGESYELAYKVYPKYFPDYDFKGFWTKSWLLDSRFDGLLPPDSNIVRLQRELFLFPGIQGDNDQIYNRVFGWGVTDYKKVEWKTSLQKAVGAYFDQGGHFHGGYCFALKGYFNWGSQEYRKMGLPKVRG